ncbi:MAG: LPS assembly protein LptD [Bilophila wadsworthia]|uniref:LPS assembly protein LptD n=1 Tax=Bilophila wadsworthia TaxID=35833 RepID=UPI00300ED222
MLREQPAGVRKYYPKLSVPLDFGFGSVIGTVGLRQTYYNTDRKEHTSPLAMYMDNSASPRQTGESRTMIDMDIQGYTEASRIWQLGDESSIPLKPENAGKQMWTAVRHEIQPRDPVFPHAAC